MTTTTRNELTVANEIRRQLGRALVMIGAYNLGGTADSLSFGIRGCRDFTHVKITLTAADDYTVTFYKIRGTKFLNQVEKSGIYSDMLANVIEDVTGLAVSL